MSSLVDASSSSTTSSSAPMMMGRCFKCQTQFQFVQNMPIVSIQCHNCNTISQFAAPPATNATPPPAQPQPQMFGHQFQQPQQQQQFVQHQAPTLTVNRQPVNAQQQQLLMQLGCTSGDLWYDHTSGGWGIMGGPCRGAIRANLPLPGPMPVDASNGNTKVFLNGRELHMMDCWAISMMTGEPCLPGRWWCNEFGMLGMEGCPIPIGSLWQGYARRQAHDPMYGPSNLTSADISFICST